MAACVRGGTASQKQKLYSLHYVLFNFYDVLCFFMYGGSSGYGRSEEGKQNERYMDRTTVSMLTRDYLMERQGERDASVYMSSP